MTMKSPVSETCGICGCRLHRRGRYAEPSVRGRSHATKHHYVAERFFGRSANRRGEVREPVFRKCPWGFEGEAGVYCYDCHELLLHNPVLLPRDFERLRRLVVSRGLAERTKTRNLAKLAGRIRLFHEVIEAGLETLTRRPMSKSPSDTRLQRAARSFQRR